MQYNYKKLGNLRRYGSDFYGGYELLDEGKRIGMIDEYSRVVKNVVKKLNNGEIDLTQSGFKALNDEFFTKCESCGYIHRDGTKNNCI